GRYASEEMSTLFSAQRKFETWRRLWLWLAEEERRLGLPISEEAIAQMRAHLADIDFDAAAREEERTRHDVMAHVRVFGEAAPAARRRRDDLRFLGAKGATGTQASFLRLFDGDSAKVEELDRALARRAGFARRQTVSGQTYSRKQDDRVVHALSGLAQSAHKIGTDLRLLQHDGEIEEPFEASQVGSSAMPYKRNPMRAERICGLARHVIALSFDTAMTAATQWLERSLDDSANRRISIPDAYLACDAILVLLDNVFAGMVVHADVARRRLDAEV